MLDQPQDVLSGWMVQCISGAHSYPLPVNDPLIRRCVERSRKGFLDALVIGDDECRYCRAELAEELRLEARMCGSGGCPMQERDCKRGCILARELRDHLYPPTEKEKIVKDTSRETGERISAARELGWKIRHIFKGPRGNKYLDRVEVRNPATDERITVG